MTIRRRTTTTVVDEIDDSVDRLSATPFPPQLEGHLLSDAERGTPIGSPDLTDGEGFDSGLSHDSNTTTPTIGRTFSDLIIESKNDYRIMVVAITVLSFIIFIFKLDITKMVSFEPFKYPILLAVLLNCLWFGAVPFVDLVKWLKRKISRD